MAIAFARVSIHTRSKGHSAIAGAAYRAGMKLHDERTGETHNYAKRHDVQYSEILLPENADPKFRDRNYLWNAVEAKEKRKDAQVAKDVVIALPRHLDLETNISLAKQFAQTQFVDKGVAVDLAIHDHGDGNPHAHLYITTRRIIGSELDRYKARDLNPSFRNSKNGKGYVSEQDYWREQWRTFQNEFFKSHDIDLVVDENHIIAQRHEGRIRDKDNHYLKQINALNKQAEIEAVLNNPRSIIDTLSQRYAVFTQREIASLIFKCTDTPEQFKIAIAKVKAHSNIICLGPGADGRLHYTTRQNYMKEAKLSRQAQALNQTSRHSVSTKVISRISQNYTLTQEQQDALNHICVSKDISLLVGRAGSGKSYLMKAAKEVWQKQGFNVIGISVSGIAAKGLNQSSDIESITIASLRARLKHQSMEISQNHIIVMDEAGMTNLHDMAFVIDTVKAAGAKLVLVGDPDQLQPIGAGAPFRALAEHIGFTELNQIRRQTDQADREASKQLALGNVTDALTHYESKSAIHWRDDSHSTMNQLISDWSQTTKDQQISQSIILAHRNQDIDALNLKARQAMQSQELLKGESIPITVMCREIGDDSWDIKFVPEQIELAIGDRVLFRKNDKKLGVVNGDFGTITNLSPKQLSVKLDDDREVTFNTNEYNEFSYGYAATVHKAQGITKDNVFVYAGGQGWNRHLAYVAMTRHKNSIQLYLDNQNYTDKSQFKEHFSRDALNDDLLNWPLEFSARRGFDGNSLLSHLLDKFNIKGKVKDAWQFLYQNKDKSVDLDNPAEINGKHLAISLLYNKHIDWQTLKQIKHKDLDWLIKYRELANKSLTKQRQRSIGLTVEGILKRIHRNKLLMAKLEKQDTKLHKIISAQTASHHKEQPKDIDWFAPELKLEWEKLRTIDNKHVQWMVKFYDLHAKQNKPEKTAIFNKQINDISMKIAQNTKAYYLIKRRSVLIGKKVKLLIKTQQQSKEFYREYE